MFRCVSSPTRKEEGDLLLTPPPLSSLTIVKLDLEMNGSEEQLRRYKSTTINERRLQRYGYVVRENEDYMGRRVLEMKVAEIRKRKQPSGWMDCK